MSTNLSPPPLNKTDLIDFRISYFYYKNEVDKDFTALDSGDFESILSDVHDLLKHVEYQDKIIDTQSREEKENKEASDIFKARMSDSRQEFKERVRIMIISQSEQIYQLEAEIRTHDLYMDQLQQRYEQAMDQLRGTIKHGIKKISKLENMLEGKFGEETAGAKWNSNRWLS